MKIITCKRCGYAGKPEIAGDGKGNTFATCPDCNKVIVNAKPKKEASQENGQAQAQKAKKEDEA